MIVSHCCCRGVPPSAQAITGAVLAGSTPFIERALPWRRRLGANPYTCALPLWHLHAQTQPDTTLDPPYIKLCSG